MATVATAREGDGAGRVSGVPARAMHPLTLRFAPPLEAEFRHDYYAKSRRPLQHVLAIGTLLYGVLFIPFDYAVLPADVFRRVTLIRVVTALLLAGLFAFSFAAVFERWWQSAVAAAIVIVAVSVAAMTATNPAGGMLTHVMAPAFLLYLMVTFTVARLRFLYACVTGVVLLAVFNVAMLWTAALPLDYLLGDNMMLVSATVLGAVAAYLLERYVRSDYLHARLLAEEQARSERLLLNILPRPIAERLKDGAATIADSHAEVTVLFADIAGFTALAATRPPEQTVALLNAIFSAFDALAAAHGLEKIKTIGDAYMVVGGLPVPRPDHAAAVAAMALDMQAALERTNAEHGERLAITIGIHTGPAVAGVIGTHKFSYDLWGDTVNTASRMQSHGVPGRIQLTGATRERLGDAFECRERGVLDVKGKGAMRTFFLLRRAAGTTDEACDDVPPELPLR